MKLLAIDPGTTQSAYVIIDSETYKPLDFGKIDNTELLSKIHLTWPYELGDIEVCIEMVKSYGMSVGDTTFETCVWIGQFKEACINCFGLHEGRVTFLYRKIHVCMNICLMATAADKNIIQALIDRFAGEYRDKNRGKGTKKDPGFFYGFAGDIWQAYAVGVTYLDMRERGEI